MIRFANGRQNGGCAVVLIQVSDDKIQHRIASGGSYDYLLYLAAPQGSDVRSIEVPTNEHAAVWMLDLHV